MKTLYVNAIGKTNLKQKDESTICKFTLLEIERIFVDAKFDQLNSSS